MLSDRIMLKYWDDLLDWSLTNTKSSGSASRYKIAQLPTRQGHGTLTPLVFPTSYQIHQWQYPVYYSLIITWRNTSQIESELVENVMHNEASALHKQMLYSPHSPPCLQRCYFSVSTKWSSQHFNFVAVVDIKSIYLGCPK